MGTLSTAQREDNEVSCEGESRHFQEDLLPLQEAGGGRIRIKGRFITQAAALVIGAFVIEK